MIFRLIKKKFLDLLFPDVACGICGGDLIGSERFDLCEDCLGKLPYIGDGMGICAKCGKPIYDEAVFCLNCQNNKRAFEKANSPLIYEASARKLVEDLKFGGKRYLARPLGKLIAVEYARRGYDADFIVPVPMFKKAEKARGFNQSLLIARTVSELVGVELKTGILIKTADTKNQTKLSGDNRKKNLLGAFEVQDRAPVKGKTVLIIDDVLTTGSTVDECTKTLLKSGALKVYALSACTTEYKLQTI